jgi:hypothetical protein
MKWWCRPHLFPFPNLDLPQKALTFLIGLLVSANPKTALNKSADESEVL